MTNYMKTIYTFILFLLISAFAEAQQKPIHLIIDADTANEVDDLFALVRAIDEPAFNLLGITSAQFHTSPQATENTVGESQQINEQIIKVMNRPEIKLPLGSNVPLASMTTPSPSKASKFIIEKAHEMKGNEKLDLVILGSCTNVASAILEDPSIISKIRVNYLGFWHTVKTNTYNKKEFNSGNDPLAVDVLLNTVDLEFNVMTATTSQHLVFKKKTIDKQLKGKGGIKDILVNRWDTYNRWWTKKDPKKKEWVMWDVALIEALINPEYATITPLETPKENTKRTIGVYTDLDKKAMEKAFWKHLNKL